MVNRKGRGAGINTPNRFEKLHLEQLDIEMDYAADPPKIQTMFFDDASRTILARNDSPDVPFTYSINPYRGCEHGCIYCYARPSHEYLGFSAGLDFESKIMVKRDAPRLLKETLQRKSWTPQVIAFSGNTDCYQPVERKLQLTRKCLQVFLEHRNPVGLITKNALILRDTDILQEMSRFNIVRVAISLTSLQPHLIRTMEPRTSTPANRLRVIEELATLNIPVGVNVGPLIPGLTDEELPAILKAAAEHGATSAGYIMVRLPGPVKDLFLDWLQRVLPERAPKIISRIKGTRNGQLSDPRFSTRRRGEGEIANTVEKLFDLSVKKYNLTSRWDMTTEHFRRIPNGQVELF